MGNCCSSQDGTAGDDDSRRSEAALLPEEQVNPSFSPGASETPANRRKKVAIFSGQPETPFVYKPVPKSAADSALIRRFPMLHDIVSERGPHGAREKIVLGNRRHHIIGEPSVIAERVICAKREVSGKRSH